MEDDISSLAKSFINLSQYFVDPEEFQWCDIGSNKFVDLNHQLLLMLRGKVFCFDGRTYNKRDGISWYEKIDTLNSAFRTKIIDLTELLNVEDAKLMSEMFWKNNNYRNDPERQKIIISKPNDRETKFLYNDQVDNSIEVITINKLSTVFENLKAKLKFVKLDVKGTEIEILQDILNNSFSKPLALEVEMYVGERNLIRGFDEQVGFLSENGYRLIDIRKTYHLPRSKLIGESELHKSNNEYPIYSPAFQGVLHQIDGLFVNLDVINTKEISQDIGLCLISILVAYRQFHLAYMILEQTLIDDKSKLEIFSILERILTLYKQISKEQGSAVYGYHPLFNYLKST